MIRLERAFLFAMYNGNRMYELEAADIESLVSWYRKNKRSFPWRDTKDPYHVWISEIMLQQTRTEAVISYFERFLKQVPDIKSLSLIEDDDLNRLWEGLGYYSRARNLKKCAIKLMEEHNGKLPEDYEALLKLPGIGPYTAGAIMAIGFGRPYPAIDGNVLRVLARYFAIEDDIRQDATKNVITKSVEDYYRKTEPDQAFVKDLSQAFMDLGATVCIPNGAPRCDLCPLRENCQAYEQKLIEKIPYRSPLKQRKIIDRTLFIIRNGDRFLLRKREEKGLLAGLYEFIGVDEKLNAEKTKEYLTEKGYDVLHLKKLPDSKHVFSHIEWHMDAYEIKIGNWDIPLKENEILVNKKELQKLAIPSAFNTYIEYYALRESEDEL